MEGSPSMLVRSKMSLDNCGLEHCHEYLPRVVGKGFLDLRRSLLLMAVCWLIRKISNVPNLPMSRRMCSWLRRSVQIRGSNRPSSRFYGRWFQFPAHWASEGRPYNFSFLRSSSLSQTNLMQQLPVSTKLPPASQHARANIRTTTRISDAEWLRYRELSSGE